MSNDILTKLKATADILGGAVFFANENGVDPENPSVNDLLPNGMYIRLEGSDNSVAYISAFEIDKAIGIIGQMSMSKANQADLELAVQTLNDKVSSTDFALLQNEVSNKASKTDIDEALDIFDEKADKTYVDEVIAQLATKANQDEVTAISDAVATKANQDEVTAIEAKIKTLQDAVALLTGSEAIESINAQIDILKNDIKARLTIDDLRGVNNSISNLNEDNILNNERLDIVETSLAKKANTTYVQGQVNELNHAITSLSARVGDKADKSELISKASKTDVDNLTVKVNNANSKITEIELEIDSNYDELTNKLNKKSNKVEVDESLNEIISSLNSKTNLSDFNAEINRISNRIVNVENTTQGAITEIHSNVEELECELNNTISELRSTVNAQSKTLNTQTNELSKLKTSSDNYNEQLKQTWVRVLSSNEYKKLTTPPEGVPYNSRYKYPNTVYLVVDFNKPKAIYIGDILVAKSEQNGSIGFAYTFPIVF